MNKIRPKKVSVDSTIYLHLGLGGKFVLLGLGGKFVLIKIREHKSRVTFMIRT